MACLCSGEGEAKEEGAVAQLWNTEFALACGGSVAQLKEVGSGIRVCLTLILPLFNQAISCFVSVDAAVGLRRATNEARLIQGLPVLCISLIRQSAAFFLSRQ